MPAMDVSLHGAGHFAHEEQPHLVHETVMGFLDGLG